jgi:hypothetical protein
MYHATSSARKIVKLRPHFCQFVMKRRAPAMRLAGRHYESVYARRIFVQKLHVLSLVSLELFDFGRKQRQIPDPNHSFVYQEPQR